MVTATQDPQEKVKQEQHMPEATWQKVAPMVANASAHSERAIVAWANIAAEVVAGGQDGQSYTKGDWRWLLNDLRERAWKDGHDCPYQVPYLIQLAETHAAVQGNFERGVPVSVLITGRHLRREGDLPDVCDLVAEYPGMTVSRMKAWVLKRAGKGDPRDVAVIEQEQIKDRARDKGGKNRRDHAIRIAHWPLTDKDLLVVFEGDAVAYRRALARFEGTGVTFKTDEVAAAKDAAQGVLDKLNVIKHNEKGE